MVTFCNLTLAPNTLCLYISGCGMLMPYNWVQYFVVFLGKSNVESSTIC